MLQSMSFSEVTTGIEPLSIPSCVGGVTMSHVMSKATGMQQSPRTRVSNHIILSNTAFM